MIDKLKNNLFLKYFFIFLITNTFFYLILCFFKVNDNAISLIISSISTFVIFLFDNRISMAGKQPIFIFSFIQQERMTEYFAFKDYNNGELTPVEFDFIFNFELKNQGSIATQISFLLLHNLEDKPSVLDITFPNKIDHIEKNEKKEISFSFKTKFDAWAGTQTKLKFKVFYKDCFNIKRAKTYNLLITYDLLCPSNYIKYIGEVKED
jgi:hypothetical protein